MDFATENKNRSKSLFVALFFLYFFYSPLYSLAATQVFEITPVDNEFVGHFVSGADETQSVSCFDLPSEGTIETIEYLIKHPDANTANLRAKTGQFEPYSPAVSVTGVVPYGWYQFDIPDFDLSTCSGSITFYLDNLSGGTPLVQTNQNEALYPNGSSNTGVGDIGLRLNMVVPDSEHSFPLYLFQPEYTEFYLVSTTTCDTLVATNTICSYEYISATTSINVNTDVDFSPLYFQVGFVLFLMSIQTWYIMFVRKN